MYISNCAECQIPMATVTSQGRAQIWSRNIATFEIEKLKIDKIILPEADWIGFIGFHPNGGLSQFAGRKQFFEIFSQYNLEHSLFKIEACSGNLITDVAVLGLDTIAIAREDGTVTVNTMVNQCILSDLLKSLDS